jgi:hypothetical protein
VITGWIGLADLDDEQRNNVLSFVDEQIAMGRGER